MTFNPFTRSEMERLVLTSKGAVWKVSDDVDMSVWVPGQGPLLAHAP
jgi:hypothetical protein